MPVEARRLYEELPGTETLHARSRPNAVERFLHEQRLVSGNQPKDTCRFLRQTKSRRCAAFQKMKPLWYEDDNNARKRRQRGYATCLELPVWKWFWSAFLLDLRGKSDVLVRAFCLVSGWLGKNNPEFASFGRHFQFSGEEQ